ncbi:MAG: aminopeptidase N [Actinomycetaceae bacterium]|nr:aminopeptidase N [Actinomycetaceae bacterium]
MQTITRSEALHRARVTQVHSIDVHLDLTEAPTDKSTFRSIATLTCEFSEPCTFIDLIAHHVESVLVDGKESAYTFTGSRIELTELPTGRPVKITVAADCEYSRTGEGLHRYVDPEDGETYLYSQYEPTDARRVYACFDQPGIKPRWSFTVKAPANWVVLSNTAARETKVSGSVQTVIFAQTLPLSSFITAIIAGPYAVFDGGQWCGSATVEEPIQVPLKAYCRQSLAQYFDSADIFAITRQGLDFYHKHYALTYPWGKYDQVFVPEYNLGAMENPGCVTFNEHFIHRDSPTRAQRQKRANVIFHEMCHMWFGDLVTPAWWDDLWLKESFADNQGSWGLAEATEFTGEWATFASGRKEWAYEQDQLPTTHPIVADIPDVEAAKHSFDGITYAKGAAVLKQLVAYLGSDAFFAGARLYFERHAYGATTLTDFLQALEESSPRDDLDKWQAAWLHTSGPTRFTIECSHRGETAYTYVLRQHCVDPITDTVVHRPHALKVGFYALVKGKMERVHTENLIMREASVTFSIPCQIAERIDFVLVNDDDLTYGIVELDERATDLALDYVGAVKSPVSRAVIWSSLWNAVRDGRLDPRRYIESALRHVAAEAEDAVAEDLLTLSAASVERYLPSEMREDIADHIIRQALEEIRRDQRPDRKRMWALLAVRVFPLLAQDNENYLAFFHDLSLGKSALMEVGPTLAWKARTALASHGRLSESDINSFLADDPSGEAQVSALRARAALPDRISRRTLWDRLVETEITNEETSAILEGLSIGTRAGHIGGFAGEFFQRVDEYWESHTIGMGNRFIAGGFPLNVDASYPDDAAALRSMSARWLNEQDEAPPALRRLMMEKHDELSRRLRIQEQWLQT